MEWLGGRINETRHGVFHLVGVDPETRRSVLACAFTPPVFPLFLPKYESDPAHGEGMLLTAYSFERGRSYWGQFGAAGVTVRRRRQGGVFEYLLGQRSNVHGGQGAWAFFGGAHDSFEHSLEPLTTALKELEEESGIRLRRDVKVVAQITFDRDPQWRYDTFVVEPDHDAASDLEAVLNWEHSDAGWFSVAELFEMREAKTLFRPVARGLESLLRASGEDLS